MDFPTLAIFDISIQSVPFDDISTIIVQWVHACQKPSIFTVRSSKPRLGLSPLSGSHDFAPKRLESAEIVRMNRRRPTPIQQLLWRQSDIVAIMLVYEFD